MANGLLEARGGGSMRGRRERAAEACPSQAQAMEHSCSAHLLSVVHQAGLHFHAAACVHMELTDALYGSLFKCLGLMAKESNNANQLVACAIQPHKQPVELVHSGRVGRAPLARQSRQTTDLV